MGKILWSKVKVRFADCDPMRHLYSGNYFRYFLDAREDQIYRKYGLDLSKTAENEGVAWVVVENQIAYLRPALVSEHLHISSCLVFWSEKISVVEMLMYNEDKSEVKSLQWTRFAFVDVKSQKAIPHTPKYRNLFSTSLQKIDEKEFEERFRSCRSFNRGDGSDLYDVI